MNKTRILSAELALSAAVPSLVNAQTVTWTATSSPVQSNLAGGPWTLSQGANPATTYCTLGGAGVPIVNPPTTVNTMNPFYFPFVTGSGNNLQGYFDYRPDAINEAIVAANSTDGGRTWNFQQQVGASRRIAPHPTQPPVMTLAKGILTSSPSSALPGCTCSTGAVTMSITRASSSSATTSATS